MLTKIKQYILAHEQGLITLSELTVQFDVECEYMKFMLSHLVRKGYISKKNIGCSTADGCNGCSSANEEYYQRVEKRPEKIATLRLDGLCR